ncbi:hypothetical protein EAY10_20875 [Vibrio anguillarum]|nr:hypothetical protein [Vibrio anguillarum]
MYWNLTERNTKNLLIKNMKTFILPATWGSVVKFSVSWSNFSRVWIPLLNGNVYYSERMKQKLCSRVGFIPNLLLHPHFVRLSK